VIDGVALGEDVGTALGYTVENDVGFINGLSDCSIDEGL